MVKYFGGEVIIDCKHILGCGGEGIILKLKSPHIRRKGFYAFKFIKFEGILPWPMQLKNEEYDEIIRRLGEYEAALVGLGDYLEFGLSTIYGCGYNVVGENCYILTEKIFSLRSNSIFYQNLNFSCLENETKFCKIDGYYFSDACLFNKFMALFTAFVL